MKTNILEDKIISSFFESLSYDHYSSITLKNYRSDISNFIDWFILGVRSLGVFAESFSEAIPFLKKETSSSYTASLIQSNIPFATINRRLSALRRFSRYLLASQILSFDFMQGVVNVSSNTPREKIESSGEILKAFEKHMVEQVASPNTVKNYLSDTRHFLSWLEKRSI